MNVLLHMNRRRFLVGTAVGLSAIAAGPSLAQGGGDLVVATWGGDYAKLLQENVDNVYAAGGGSVLQDLGDEESRVAKMIAQKRLPSGTWDIASISSLNAAVLKDSELFETIDAQKVPNFAHIKADLANPTFIPHNYGAYTVLYNPNTVATPPKTLGDLRDPVYAGKIGLTDQGFVNNMLMGALYATGNPADMESSKTILLELKKNGVRFYPNNEALVGALKSGEIDVAPGFYARMLLWKKAGVSVEAAFLQEGAIVQVTGMVVPRNAPNKDRAFAYLNAMLDPGAQLAFANAMNYWPSIDNVESAGKLADGLVLPDPAPKMVTPDYAAAAKVKDAMGDWWRKEYING